MPATAPTTYSLDYHGRRVEVDLDSDGRRNSARMTVDGAEVATADVSPFQDATLDAAGVRVKVSWWWPGRPSSVVLLDRVDDGVVPYTDRVPLDAPPGSRAARLQQLQRERPRLFAARHVVVAVGKVAASVLGLAALAVLLLRWLRRWLPEVSLPDWRLWDWLPDLSLPDWLPDLSWPDWLPDLTMPGWLAWLLAHDAGQWVRWVVLVLVAVGVAEREVRRRRSREQRLRTPRPPAPGA
jgi:hypothetical protein